MHATSVLGIFLILLLVASSVIFLILWLNSIGKNGGYLAVNGLNFTLQNSTTVVATWESTGNSADVIYLYADTTPVDLEQSGIPNSSSHPNVLKSGPVSGNVKKITLSGLAPDTTYFLTLVVTNPGIIGINPFPYTVFTGIIPNAPFIIQELHSTGGISLNTSNSTISYQTKVNKTDVNDIWNYDTKLSTITINGVGKNSGKNFALYNNGGTLAVDDITVLQKNPNFPNVAEWTYNTFGNNRWCLKSSPDICMQLNTPIVNGSSINVVPDSKTQWVNVPLVKNF